jgi:hypothetical protein
MQANPTSANIEAALLSKHTVTLTALPAIWLQGQYHEALRAQLSAVYLTFSSSSAHHASQNSCRTGVMAQLAAFTSVWHFLAAREQEPMCCGAGKTVSVLEDPCRVNETHHTTFSHPSGPLKHGGRTQFGGFRHVSPSDQHAYMRTCTVRTAYSRIHM